MSPSLQTGATRRHGNRCDPISALNSGREVELVDEKNRKKDRPSVSVLDSKDEFPLRWSERAILRLFPLTTVASSCLAMWYWFMQYQILSHMDNGRSGISLSARHAFILSDIAFTSAEIVKKSIDAVAIVRGSFRERRYLIGDDVPDVDVAIVCCGENIDIILDTVRAAINTDYPREALRIVVSDDRGQDPVQKGVEKLRQQYPRTKLYYTARAKTPEDSHKAGNLNHVTRYLDRLPGGSARFLAGLDADMIPHPRWLRAQLPHLIGDPRMGCTCAPPMFYNTPRDDPLSQGRYAFYRFDETIKDMAGVAWCSGSGWITRREALRDVGGFPTRSFAEDVLCGMMMIGRGWRTAYVPESLQWGLVPETYYAHARQITRWSTGHLQAGLLLNGFIPSYSTEHMNVLQRVHGLWYFLSPVFCTASVVEVFQRMAIVALQWPHVVFATDWQLVYLLRLSACRVIVDFLHQGIVAHINGYAASRSPSTLSIISVYSSVDHFRTFILPLWLGGHPEAFSAKFPSTGSLPDVLHERHPSRRAPLSTRLRVILWKQGAIWLVLISVMYAVSVGLTVWKSQALDDRHARFQYLLVRILWPTARWQGFAAIFAQPLVYAIFPPNMAEREDLLVRDANGVAYPKQESINPKSRIRGLGIELVDTMTVVWAAFVLVGSLCR